MIYTNTNLKQVIYNMVEDFPERETSTKGKQRRKQSVRTRVCSEAQEGRGGNHRA